MTYPRNTTKRQFLRPGLLDIIAHAQWYRAQFGGVTPAPLIYSFPRREEEEDAWMNWDEHEGLHSWWVLRCLVSELLAMAALNPNNVRIWC